MYQLFLENQEIRSHKIEKGQNSIREYESQKEDIKNQFTQIETQMKALQAKENELKVCELIFFPFGLRNAD